MTRKTTRSSFYKASKIRSHNFNPSVIASQFSEVSLDRVDALAEDLSGYLTTHLPQTFEKKRGVRAYRTNPYVLMTSASIMKLKNPRDFARFLFNSKFYMALETSFGKSVESEFVRNYPIDSSVQWEEPAEKIAESSALKGLSPEEKAQHRTESVWREIDKSCIVGTKRYLTLIKSGPNTINDTQVQAMTRAIIDNHESWLEQTQISTPFVTELDIVLGLTYGTDKTTNNKDNQILVKLLDHGFEEENRETNPGVLINANDRTTRVYRRVGQDFWSFLGRPDNPDSAGFVYLEILLGLAKALSVNDESHSLEEKINRKISELSGALAQLQFSEHSLPIWVMEEFSEDELLWFATAMTAFFDDGI